eukprot:13194644-Alexandrium_andersonii.AAC.1
MPVLAVGLQLGGVKVRVPLVVMLLDIAPSLVHGNSLGQSCLAARHWTPPARALVRQVGKLLRVKVVELTDEAEQVPVHTLSLIHI